MDKEAADLQNKEHLKLKPYSSCAMRCLFGQKVFSTLFKLIGLIPVNQSYFSIIDVASKGFTAETPRNPLVGCCNILSNEVFLNHQT